MDDEASWRDAFPLQSAAKACDALLQAWSELVAVRDSAFNATMKEPGLTKRLKMHVQNHVSRERGLLGMWAAEDVIGEVDPGTGELVEERRTDIVYGWNDDAQDFELVFEFKRLGKLKRYRKEYLGKNGLLRFVTDIYGRGQAIAAMVGVLLEAKEEVVPGLRLALADAVFANPLRLVHAGHGKTFIEPSSLFVQAEFDTQHERDPALAPPHGHITVAHFFLSFEGDAPG